jgi:hypothetical protein
MEYCIYETDSDYKARILINILKKKKINSYCKNFDIQNLYGDSKLFTGNDLIVGEIKIYVEKKDIRKAKQIINDNPILEKKFKTIEDDVNEKNKYIAQRSLMFSMATFFILPFFFNLEYLIYCFKNKFRTRYILLILNILFISLSVMFCINSLEYIKFLWKGNFYIMLVFSIGKYIELYKKKSKIKYFMVLLIVLIFTGYNIIDQIKLFG